MFQNSAQLWSERDDITGEWRRLLTEQLYKLYSSSIIPRVMESRCIWAMHVACMGTGEAQIGFC